MYRGIDSRPSMGTADSELRAYYKLTRDFYVETTPKLKSPQIVRFGQEEGHGDDWFDVDRIAGSAQQRGAIRTRA
jgi:hypothetical protein